MDTQHRTCETRWNALLAEPDLGGTPAFDNNRAGVLAVALGEPMVFVREPRTDPDSLLSPALQAIAKAYRADTPGVRVLRTIQQYRRNPHILRTILLPEGYVYASDPRDAKALVQGLRLSDVFDEPMIWMQRRDQVIPLERTRVRGARVYRVSGGVDSGQEARLVFGDRVTASPAGLAQPLHRDLRTFAGAAGFDRVRIVHRSMSAMGVELRFGGQWVRTLLRTEGATVRVACINEPISQIGRVEAWIRSHSSRIRAREVLESTIEAMLQEDLPVDRPRNARDRRPNGFLRPLWYDAYRRGKTTYLSDGRSIPIFDPMGQPRPPQTSVDVVLDTFARASGAWYSPRESPFDPARRGLYFELEITETRRSVSAFQVFAESEPAWFQVEEFPKEARIPLGDRSRFLGYLRDHGDDFAPFDVVATFADRGDGVVIRNLFLVESTDPLSGIPHGLFGQMGKTRRATWDGISDDAAEQTLDYRVRLTDKAWRELDPLRGEVKPSPFPRDAVVW